MDLFAVYLGGPVAPGRMGEDHEVVFVVAADDAQARVLAKAKWTGLGRCHVDAVQRLDEVDGHVVSLAPSSAGRAEGARRGETA
jgi:hypothetical protein